MKRLIRREKYIPFYIHIRPGRFHFVNKSQNRCTLIQICIYTILLNFFLMLSKRILKIKLWQIYFKEDLFGLIIPLYRRWMISFRPILCPLPRVFLSMACWGSWALSFLYFFVCINLKRPNNYSYRRGGGWGVCRGGYFLLPYRE